MIKIKELKCIKTITAHSSDVYSLLLLKDNRIASSSKDGTIRIFNPSNDYNCDKVLERYNESILSMCQTENGTIVSCSYEH